MLELARLRAVKGRWNIRSLSWRSRCLRSAGDTEGQVCSTCAHTSTLFVGSSRSSIVSLSYGGAARWRRPPHVCGLGPAGLPPSPPRTAKRRATSFGLTRRERIGNNSACGECRSRARELVLCTRNAPAAVPSRCCVVHVRGGVSSSRARQNDRELRDGPRDGRVDDAFARPSLWPSAFTSARRRGEHVIPYPPSRSRTRA